MLAQETDSSITCKDTALLKRDLLIGPVSMDKEHNHVRG
jgi:hypothetical protein